MQDLGRLLRRFPEENPEPVETLIPAHPDLIDLAVSALNEIAHVVRERDENDSSQNDSRDNEVGNSQGGQQLTLSNFMPISSTGELGKQIVDGEEIDSEYANVAEWLIANRPIGQYWNRTAAHLAQMLMEDKVVFDAYRKEYEKVINQAPINQSSSTVVVPDGFPSEYGGYLPTKKTAFARREANRKAYRLACILYGNASEEEKKEKVKQIHTIAKSRNCLPTNNSFIAHEGWERIYQWLCDRITEAPMRIKRIEDL